MSENLDIIYQVAYEKLKSQLDNSRSIDTKSAVMLAVYGVVINALSSKMPSKFSCELLVFAFIISFIVILIGMILCICSLTTRRFKYPPDLSNLKKKYLLVEEVKIKRKLLASFIDAHRFNANVVARKLRWLNLSIRVFLPIAIVMSMITIIANSLGG